MRLFPAGIVVAAMITSSAALAKDRPSANASQQLKQALTAIAAAAKPPSEFNPKTDRDQGDDRANAGAILRVCSKNTPAAHRSAICPVGVSPQ